MRYLTFLLCLLSVSLGAQDALIVFVSNPETRFVKTRIALESSTEIAETFYHHCLAILTESFEKLSERYTIVVSPALNEDVSWVRTHWPSFQILSQVESDHLGDRIQHALNRLLDLNFERVLLIGSDAPSLPLEYIDHQCELLETCDAVIGKAEDGGFYLFGTTKKVPSLNTIQFSSGKSFDQLKAALASADFKVVQGPTWYDIDYLADFQRLKWDLKGTTGARARLADWLQSLQKVSIILPVFNQEETILGLLDQMRSLVPKPELIFVDGGSSDGTVESLSQRGAKVLIAPRKERALQQRLGAERAQGDYLLFLTEGSSFSQAKYDAMVEALDDQEIAGGVFVKGHLLRRLVGQGIQEGVFMRQQVLQHLTFDAEPLQTFLKTHGKLVEIAQ